MEDLYEWLRTLERKDERLLSKKEKDFVKLMNTVYLTVEGKITIPGLIEEFGEPVIIKKYAKVEAKTGSTKVAMIVVERFVDAVLHFTNQVVIPGIPQNILLDVPHSGIKVEWIRHPNYSHENMPKATKAEVRRAMVSM